MIWLVGAKGMLGRELSALLKVNGTPFIASDVEVDILDPMALREFQDRHGADFIVNAAAYTAVDKAEEEESLATHINGEGPANLARLAASTGSALLHISTDYVFSGEENLSLTEEEPVDPINAYGRSKLAGERSVTALAERHVILRTSWLYGNSGPSFVHSMLRLMSERETIHVVADQIGSPTCTYDLANAIVSIISSERRESGIFHYSGDGETTWYEFARYIRYVAIHRGILDDGAAEIKSISTSEYPTAARRPAYSLMDKAKIKKTFGLAIPMWRDALERYFEEDYYRWNDD